MKVSRWESEKVSKDQYLLFFSLSALTYVAPLGLWVGQVREDPVTGDARVTGIGLSPDRSGCKPL